jgi:hypothetical protein
LIPLGLTRSPITFTPGLHIFSHISKTALHYFLEQTTDLALRCRLAYTSAEEAVHPSFEISRLIVYFCFAPTCFAEAAYSSS